MNKNRVFIIPGNHDVDRDLADSFAEDGLRKNLQTSAQAEAIINTPDHGYRRLSAYHEYIKSYQEHPPAHYRTQIVNVNGVNVGIACFDTAWRCYDDSDKGHLFVTQEQVYPASQELKDADIRIAMLHHPYLDLHPTEQDEVIPDIKRFFDIITRGHLHTSYSVGEVTPSDSCLELAVPALCEGRSPDVGYNIYYIDLKNKKINVRYRKFFRSRNKFDRHTEHADDGEHEFALSVKDVVKYSKGVLSQNIALASSKLEALLHSNLQLLQNAPSSIYIDPPVHGVTMKHGSQITAPCEKDLYACPSRNTVIYGSTETGKSILLQKWGAEINKRSSLSGSSEFAVYINFQGVRLTAFASLIEKSIKENMSASEENAKPSAIYVLADHISQEDNSAIKALASLSKANPHWRFVCSINSELLFKALISDKELSEWAFYKLKYWGPSRIREFTKEYLKEDQIDVNTAYNFVCNSLRNSDLPATPTIVVLYLSVFRLIGNQVSSLSFVNLLEKFEELRLRSSKNSAENALFNKRRLLATLATELYVKKRVHVEKQEFLDMIRHYFEIKLLTVNAEDLMQELVASGFLEIEDTGDSIRFKRFVFFDYYLAVAFRDGLIDLEDNMSSLTECINIATALAIYGGLTREDSKAIHQLVNLIENAIPTTSQFDLEALDVYISDLLLPSAELDGIDSIATSDIEAQIDYEDMDEDFAEDQKRFEQRRKALAEQTSTSPSIHLLDNQVYALKAFYNLFRNLENLPGQEKVDLLKRLVDLHIQLNHSLIEYSFALITDTDIQTFFAYLVTLGGQTFMSANVGNQSLKETINATIAQCDNDFKRLLLIFLYCDLRLPGYTVKLDEFVSSTKSRSAIEMIYVKIREIMIAYDGKELPLALLNVFRTTVAARVKMKYPKHPQSKGSFMRIYQKALQQTKLERSMRIINDNNTE